MEAIAIKGGKISAAGTNDEILRQRGPATTSCLLGVDTLKLSPGEAAEILQALLPGFQEGIFSPPAVEAVSLDEALKAYQAVFEGTSGKKFVIRFA
jgi:hypothetical protein